MRHALLLLLLQPLATYSAACSATPPPAPPEPPPAPAISWLGQYHFSESCGHSVGGSSIGTQHTLRIEQDGAATVVHLASDGFQVMERSRGVLDASGDTATAHLVNGTLQLRHEGDALMVAGDYTTHCTQAARFLLDRG